MITGGTESFGNAVLNRSLETDVGEIRIFSRDEKMQDDMRHEYQTKYPEASGKIRFYIGDVRDIQSVKNAMAEKYDIPISYSCHPRSKKSIAERGFEFDKRVIQHQTLCFHDYNNLQMNAFAFVSDSGTLPKESSYFISVGNPFFAVCIRMSTERPEVMDRGNFILAGITTEQVLQVADTAVSMYANCDFWLPVRDYMDENVFFKVVKLIQSYTGIVNKMV